MFRYHKIKTEIIYQMFENLELTEKKIVQNSGGLFIIFLGSYWLANEMTLLNKIQILAILLHML